MARSEYWLGYRDGMLCAVLFLAVRNGVLRLSSRSWLQVVGDQLWLVRFDRYGEPDLVDATPLLKKCGCRGW